MAKMTINSTTPEIEQARAHYWKVMNIWLALKEAHERLTAQLTKVDGQVQAALEELKEAQADLAYSAEHQAAWEAELAARKARGE